MTSHPVSAIPLYIAIMLERLVYYGTRSVIILYLIDGAMHMPISDALQIYGWVATILLFSQIAGGLIGLLNQPRALTIVGYAIQFVGATIISLVQDANGLVIGFFLLVMGSGISKTNSLALLSQVYQKSKLLDSAVMINYAGINIGSFIGAFTVSLLADEYSFPFAFYFCAAVMLLALILIILVQPDSVKEKKADHQSQSYTTTFIIIASVTVALFWMSYEFLSTLIASSARIMTNQKLMDFSSTGSSTLNFILLMITASILAIYLTFKRIHSSIFLSIGFACGIIAVFLLSFISNSSFSVDSIYFYLLGFYFFITLAELFVGPPLTSFILQKVNLQFIPLVLTGCFGLISLLSMGVRMGYEHENRNTITFCLILFGFAFASFMLLAKKRPKEDQNSLFKDQIIE